MARPTSFEVLVDLAHLMWAPVFRELSQEDLDRLNKTPYNEALYVNPSKDSPDLLAAFRVQRRMEAPVDSITWIEPRQVDLIHDRLIHAFGGADGTRLPGQVAGYIDRARHSFIHGHDPFPTIFEKAGHILRMVLVGHPYLDGQKRTGLATAFVFLGLNGYALWARNQMDEVHFAIEVARGEREVDVIAAWLRKRVGPLQVGRGNANIVAALGGPKVPPRCFTCQRFVRFYGYRAVCARCGIVYELTARAVGLAEGRGGRNIEARIGLHKTGAGQEAMAAVTKDHSIQSRLSIEPDRASRSGAA